MTSQLVTYATFTAHSDNHANRGFSENRSGSLGVVRHSRQASEGPKVDIEVPEQSNRIIFRLFPFFHGLSFSSLRSGLAIALLYWFPAIHLSKIK